MLKLDLQVCQYNPFRGVFGLYMDFFDGKETIGNVTDFSVKVLKLYQQFPSTYPKICIIKNSFATLKKTIEKRKQSEFLKEVVILLKTQGFTLIAEHYNNELNLFTPAADRTVTYLTQINWPMQGTDIIIYENFDWFENKVLPMLTAQHQHTEKYILLSSSQDFNLYYSAMKDLPPIWRILIPQKPIIIGE